MVYPESLISGKISQFFKQKPKIVVVGLVVGVVVVVVVAVT